MTTLVSGRLRLILAPKIGGSIARFDWMDRGTAVPLLRGADDPDRSLDAACFPLVPYCNRIRKGRFTFEGREIVIAPNMAGDPSPLHGQGWLGPWQVATASEVHCELLFQHAPGEWPWRYSARQLFTLSPDGLHAELSCTNEDATAMPCGLGFHPYFPCAPTTRLATQVAKVWTVDQDVLPVAHVAATGRYDLSGGPICGRGLDNGYDQWSGEAWIDGLPDVPLRLRLSSTNAGFFQLYSPTEGGLFVAEPVSHANAALNEPTTRWAELGLRVLAPGETMRLDMWLTLA